MKIIPSKSLKDNDNDCTQLFLLGLSFSNTVSSDKLDKFAFRPPLLLSRRRSPAGPIFHHHGQLDKETAFIFSRLI
ncbi:hypothetical protein L1887_20225 [Cichorium endivia]|nr:hypothetical protein L1887_20225 [Cichorium endivia]